MSFFIFQLKKNLDRKIERKKDSKFNIDRNTERKIQSDSRGVYRIV